MSRLSVFWDAAQRAMMAHGMNYGFCARLEKNRAKGTQETKNRYREERLRAKFRIPVLLNARFHRRLPGLIKERVSLSPTSMILPSDEVDGRLHLHSLCTAQNLIEDLLEIGSQRNYC